MKNSKFSNHFVREDYVTESKSQSSSIEVATWDCNNALGRNLSSISIDDRSPRMTFAPKVHRESTERSLISCECLHSSSDQSVCRDRSSRTISGSPQFGTRCDRTRIPRCEATSFDLQESFSLGHASLHASRSSKNDEVSKVSLCKNLSGQSRA